NAEYFRQFSDLRNSREGRWEKPLAVARMREKATLPIPRMSRRTGTLECEAWESACGSKLLPVDLTVASLSEVRGLRKKSRVALRLAYHALSDHVRFLQGSRCRDTRTGPKLSFRLRRPSGRRSQRLTRR